MDLGVAQADHLPRRVALWPAHQQIPIAFVSILSFPTVSASIQMVIVAMAEGSCT